MTPKSETQLLIGSRGDFGPRKQQPRSESLPKPPNSHPGGTLEDAISRRVWLGPGVRRPAGKRAAGLVKRTKKASAARKVAPLLTLRSPRAAGRRCGARCGVRDPERCGPSRCWSLRGLGLGGGASLLGWERPEGQGGSERAESPPRPTAAGGGPASQGRFHLRAGTRPGASAAIKATGPRPGCNPQPVGGEGAARGGRDCEGGGAGWARDGRHARSAWALAAGSARTEPRENFPRELRTTAPPLSQAAPRCRGPGPSSPRAAGPKHPPLHLRTASSGALSEHTANGGSPPAAVPASPLTLPHGSARSPELAAASAASPCKNSRDSEENYVPTQNPMSSSPVSSGPNSPASKKSTGNVNYIALDVQPVSQSPHRKSSTSSVSSEEKGEYVQVGKEKTQALQKTIQEWTKIRQSSRPCKDAKLW
ncbi:hypothetical protein NN561_009110 [Cricetulus griseus]